MSTRFYQETRISKAYNGVQLDVNRYKGNLEQDGALVRVSAKTQTCHCAKSNPAHSLKRLCQASEDLRHNGLVAMLPQSHCKQAPNDPGPGILDPLLTPCCTPLGPMAALEIQQRLAILPHTGNVQSLSEAVCVLYKHNSLTCFIMADTLKKEQKGKACQLRSSVLAVTLPCPTCDIKQIPRGTKASPRKAMGSADDCDQALHFMARFSIG
ncbi:MAG: hypothetical protein FRX49_03468 [Trebouxia sp. A1-2]|nr:MAG: hypothetical protein FRX49_03468 [Trebouxia sp. A1-2]